MKALVTGATGFVGSHLCERLLREGLTVVCLTRPTSSLRWLEGLPVQTRTGSLDDADSLAAAADGADYVFHCAGMTRARSAGAYLAANAEGTRRLLAAVGRSGSGLRRFVLVSSQAAAGPNRSPAPVEEADEPRPIDAYGASKLEAEQIAMAESGRVPVTVVRPPAVYGPRDRNFAPLFRMARRLGFVPAPAGGMKELSLVHAADLAEGLWRAASSAAAAGQTYFISGGAWSLAEIVAALGSALQRNVRPFPIPRWLARLAGEAGEGVAAVTGRFPIVSRRKVRDMLQERWTCSWQKAARDLGYTPAVGLAEGMAQTARWYEAKGWIPG